MSFSLKLEGNKVILAFCQRGGGYRKRNPVALATTQFIEIPRNQLDLWLE